MTREKWAKTTRKQYRSYVTMSIQGTWVLIDDIEMMTEERIRVKPDDVTYSYIVVMKSGKEILVKYPLEPKTKKVKYKSFFGKEKVKYVRWEAQDYFDHENTLAEAREGRNLIQKLVVRRLRAKTKTQKGI